MTATVTAPVAARTSGPAIVIGNNPKPSATSTSTIDGPIIAMPGSCGAATSPVARGPKNCAVA